jgi:hypothetical protein
VGCADKSMYKPFRFVEEGQRALKSIWLEETGQTEKWLEE